MSNSQELDREFVQSLQLIELNYQALCKQLQIRIERWVGKLLSSDENLQWRKSRNNYIKLLAHMITESSLSSPFDKMPTQHELPTLSDLQLSLRMNSHSKVHTREPSHVGIKLIKCVEPLGDRNENMTPFCTYRNHQESVPNDQPYLSNIKHEQSSIEFKTQHGESKILSFETRPLRVDGETVKVLYKLMAKYELTLSHEQNYHTTLMHLRSVILKMESLEANQLQIQEGIEGTKSNFKDSNIICSTQIQYFKQAFQDN